MKALEYFTTGLQAALACCLTDNKLPRVVDPEHKTAYKIVQTIQILQGSPRTLTCSAAQCILSLRIHDHESFVFSSPRDLRLGRFVTHPSLKGNLDLRPQDAKGCQAPFNAPCMPWPTSVPGLKFSLGELLVLLYLGQETTMQSEKNNMKK